MEAVEQPEQRVGGEEAPAAEMPPMSEEEKKEAWKKFESIVYKNLEKILEKRPAYPVTKFAKAILEEVDLDENGDKILKKKKKKDKKKKDKDKKDKKDKGDKDKKEKKDKGDKDKKEKKDKGEKKDKDGKEDKGEKKKKDKEKASAAADEEQKNNE